MLQRRLCQFRGVRGGRAPAGMTEGGEYVMGKIFWQTVAAKPDGRYYRVQTERAETLTDQQRLKPQITPNVSGLFLKRKV